jgi:haloacid dehalogenase-like hydrolase
VFPYAPQCNGFAHKTPACGPDPITETMSHLLRTRLFVVQYFADKWGIEYCLATTLEDFGRIDHVWPEHKAQWLLELSARLGIPRAHTAAVGDSAGDYEMLSVAGTSIFVGTELPPQQQGWIHWPAADIAHIARHLSDALPLNPP